MPAKNNNHTRPQPKVNKKATVVGAILLAIAVTLGLEGGYVNDPVDPGGETNHGVTIGTARERGYEGPMRNLKRECDFPIELPASVAETLDDLEVEDLEADSDGTEKCAAEIYFEGYIKEPGFVPLFVTDPWVAMEVFDTAINMGPTRPSRFFQRSVNRYCGTNLAVDGRVGPMTAQAWHDCRTRSFLIGPVVCKLVLADLDRQQANEYHRLIRNNPSLNRFRRGWFNHRIGNVDPANCGKEI